MKFLGGCILCLALTATGCVEMPLWKESNPVPPPAAKPKHAVPAVTADEIDETNAHAKAQALWDELDRDLTCRCIILTGVGQRAFTVGADISGDLSAGPETARMVNHALLKNDAYSKPIVAAVRSLGGEVLGDERCVRRR